MSKKDDLKLKVGNLILAIFLSVVPTAITYASLGVHGQYICNNLSTKLEGKEKDSIKELCKASSWETTKSYIVLIGFFITLPTWLWFYLSVKRKRVT